MQTLTLNLKRNYPFLFQEAKCIKNYIRNDVHILLTCGLHKCLVLAAKVTKIHLVASPVYQSLCPHVKLENHSTDFYAV